MTPTPPGVAETLLEIELEAVTVATLWKLTGIAVGAEEDGDDRQPGRVAAELGQDDAGEGAARRAQDRAAGEQLLRSFARRSQKMRASRTSRTTAADRDQHDQPRCGRRGSRA